MIVNSTTDYNNLINLCNTATGMVAVIPSNATAHPSIGKISFVYYRFSNGQSYILGKTHPDTLEQYDLVFPVNGYILNKKDSMQLTDLVSHLKDINSLWYVSGNKLGDASEHYSVWMQNFIQTFSDTTLLSKRLPINNIIPMAVWQTALDSFTQSVGESMPDESASFNFFNEIVIPSLAAIEKNGLYVNTTKFDEAFAGKKHCVSNNLVYTSYNPFTITSRPSNAYQGINYAALNKSDGSREVFESRFGETGVLLQLDFDAYHLRLLANAMGIELPSNSLHEVLAQEYFGTSDITAEQYEEGKKVTFQFLYGNITPTEDMPLLLRNVHNHIVTIVKEYKTNHCLQTSSGRRITQIDGGMHKVFNYYVQSLEAETTYKMLHRLVENLKGMKSKAVLYTYDSVLFDVELSELEQIKQIIYNSIDTKQFPITLSMGTNYNALLDM